MSSAKPTPRYVQRISPPNIHLVGPTAEAQVIPIRRVTPAYVPVVDAPAKPAPAPGRPTRFVPVERRPWRVMIVPPTPGAQTRSFGVARWQAQVVIASLAVMLLVAGGAVAAFVGAVEAPDLFLTSADAQLRERLLVLEDSLALARAELSSDEAPGDSLFDVVPSAAIPMPVDAAPTRTTAARLAARKPATRSRNDGPALMPRSLEDLPVVGRLASGFSRSRRHPILHIRRPHLGVDVAAPKGTHITAPADGKVVFVGRKFGYGLVVELEHPSGVRTRYAHLKEAVVHVGDQVTRGTQIAAVGSSGLSTGPHLHYEVLVNGRQVDPLRYRWAPVIAPEATSAPAPAPVPEAANPATIVPGASTPSSEMPAPVQMAPAP
jgi:murein DD-endopeptidase MepM/ murein hydrolase activator NlpD